MRRLLIAMLCLIAAPCFAAGVRERYVAQFSGPERAIAVSGVRFVDTAVGVGAAEFVRDRLRERAPGDAELQRLAVLQLIDAYLVAGLSSKAVDVYDSLDVAARDNVFGGEPVLPIEQRERLGDLVPGIDDEERALLVPQIVAGGLAAAYAEAGRTDAVEGLLRHASRPVAVESVARDLRGTASGIGDCVRGLVDASADTDWFLWLFGKDSMANDPGCARIIAPPAYRRLMKARLDASGMPAGWRAEVERSDISRMWWSTNPEVTAALLQMPPTKARVDELRRQLKASGLRAGRPAAARPRDTRLMPEKSPGPATLALATSVEARLAVSPAQSAPGVFDAAMRDTDGDGLTDFAELAMLTDPNAVDTDGDGLADDVDPLPNVAYRVTAKPQTAALAAALREVTGERDLRATVGGRATALPSRDASTHYLFADPELLSGVNANLRIVVVPATLDLAALRQHPALASALSVVPRIRLTLLDATHAELICDAGFRGATLALHRRNGVWRVGLLSAWIH